MALSEQGDVFSELSWRSKQNHSSEVVSALRLLIERAGATPDQIESVFVARGPGAFSALRVGISFAKAFAVGRDIPLVAVGTMDVEAQPYLGLGMPVCVVIPAGRELVYTAVYDAPDADDRPDPQYGVATREQLVSTVPEPGIICGEAASTLADQVGESGGLGVHVTDQPPPTRSPAVLAKLGYRRLDAGDTDDPETLQPIYIRGSQFEVAGRAKRTV